MVYRKQENFMTNFAINQGDQQQLFVQPVVAVPSNEISADIIEQLNDLIMAQYDMSLFERRIFIAIIEQISDDLLEVGSMKVIPEILLDARQIIATSGSKESQLSMNCKKLPST